MCFFLNVKRNMIYKRKRLIKCFNRMIESGEWKEAFGQFFGHLGSRLRGKTLGIVGMGRIGQAVATRLASFEIGSPILYTSRRGPKNNDPVVQRLDAKHVMFDDLVRMPALK